MLFEKGKKKPILHIMTWKILEKINGLSNTARKKPVNYFLSLFFTRNEIPMCLSRLLLLKTMMICSILGAGRSACIITLGNSDPFVSVIISHFFHSVQSLYVALFYDRTLFKSKVWPFCKSKLIEYTFKQIQYCHWVWYIFSF